MVMKDIKATLAALEKKVADAKEPAAMHAALTEVVAVLKHLAEQVEMLTHRKGTVIWGSDPNT
jgi:hypothetical protein